MPTKTKKARIDEAIAELEALIKNRYPEATFKVGKGFDPPGTYLTATVDDADAYELLDLVIDRLMFFQEEQRLPLHVIPAQTPERIQQIIREQLEEQASEAQKG